MVSDGIRYVILTYLDISRHILTYPDNVADSSVLISFENCEVCQAKANEPYFATFWKALRD